MDVAYARLCLPWLAAVALTSGEIKLGDFTPNRLSDPALQILADRVTVSEEGSDPAAFTPLRANAVTTDGLRFETEVVDMLGSPANPLTRDQHLQKARLCLAHAGLEAAHERLATAIAGLDRAHDVALSLRI
jgi:2-methylcitrate dehydratase PrpD